MIKVYQTLECKNNVITTISFKGVKVKVEFKGGNVMKGIPARLYTNDPFVQKALDESDQNGRMYRFVQELPEAGDVKTAKAPAKRQTTKLANGKVENPEEPAHGMHTPDSTDGTDAPEPGFPDPSDTEDGGGEGGDGSGQKLEFENLAEAITYIAATWGEQVENESQARKFIEEKTGTKPVIHKG